MKTIPSDYTLDDLMKLYDKDVQEVILSLDAICKKESNSVAKIFGRDIIGYGDITYSNTYVKDQPWFRVGFRVSKIGITLYLNAYNETLYKLADELNITYGKGCYYMKKKDFQRLEAIQLLIKTSLRHF